MAKVANIHGTGGGSVTERLPVSLEVAVVEHETERTVTTVKAANLRDAGKIERGMNINLDHRFYYTEVRVAR